MEKLVVAPEAGLLYGFQQLLSEGLRWAAAPAESAGNGQDTPAYLLNQQPKPRRLSTGDLLPGGFETGQLLARPRDENGDGHMRRGELVQAE
jgi:hypothetical protein